MEDVKHAFGKLESIKFDHRRDDFYKYIGHLNEQNLEIPDLLEHYSAYAGHMSLNRLFTLYELYKKVQEIAGHIAEIGVYKGAGTLLFSKLVQIFEGESLTQVHGFDWFKGTGRSGENDSGLVHEGGYDCDYNSLIDLVNLQKLDHIVRIHNIDMTGSELTSLFETNKHLQFKLVFMDAGMYDIMKNCIPIFWERLSPGGIMIFDQFNHELGPGETVAIREFLPNAVIRTIPNSWMPNAYVIKE